MTGEFDSEYYAKAREMALGMAIYRTRGSLRAEDVAQMAMLRLMKLPEPPDNLEAWLRTVVFRLTVDKVRADKRRPDPLGDDIDDRAEFVYARHVSASQQAIRQENFSQIWRDLGEVLTRKELDVLQLTVEGKTQAEIAEELGYASADSVKTTLSRIRRKVRELGTSQIAEWIDHPRVY